MAAAAATQRRKSAKNRHSSVSFIYETIYQNQPNAEGERHIVVRSFIGSFIHISHHEH